MKTFCTTGNSNRSPNSAEVETEYTLKTTLEGLVYDPKLADTTSDEYQEVAGNVRTAVCVHIILHSLG